MLFDLLLFVNYLLIILLIILFIICLLFVYNFIICLLFFNYLLIICLLFVYYLLGELDCLATLSHVALYNEWVRPTFTSTPSPLINNPGSSPYCSSEDMGYREKDVIVNETSETSETSAPYSRLELVDLRHPLLEATLGPHRYVPSTVTLNSSQQMCIITGPNMGGKSTFMRAVGICAVLAHMGSFVPAKSARLPVFDKLFARIGAGDCLTAGVSTFMAEMLSMSNILQNSTSESLLLVDELGEFLFELLFFLIV